MFKELKLLTPEPVLFPHAPHGIEMRKHHSGLSWVLSLTLCNPINCCPPDPLSMGFSRQDYWSRLSFPLSGHFPDPGLEPSSLISCTGRWILSYPGSPGVSYIHPFPSLTEGPEESDEQIEQVKDTFHFAVKFYHFFHYQNASLSPEACIKMPIMNN